MCNLIHTSGNVQRSGSAIPRGIISVDKKWRLKVTNSFGARNCYRGENRAAGTGGFKR